MKTENLIKSLIKYSTLSTLTLFSGLHAIERPTPAAQPKEKEAADKVIPMPKTNVSKIPYLGVFGEPISDTLATQLNLAKGIGIELKIVAGRSPAAIAGLKEHDIITNLAGKDITSQDDLGTSLANKKPGDKIELNYISKGNLISENITLGSRFVPRARRADNQNIPQRKQQQAELGNLNLPKEFLNKFPKGDREKLMQLFEGNIRGLDLQELQRGLGKLEGFDLNLLPQGLNPEMNKGLRFKGSFQSRVKMLDQHGSITLKSTKDGKIIELLDHNGNLQYRGPYNNEADKNKIPPELRDRVKNLDIDNSFGFLRGNKNKLNLQVKDLRELHNQFKMPDNLNQLLQKDNKANRHKFEISSNGVSSSMTDRHTGNRYTFKNTDGKKQIEVYSPSGKLLYGGAYNSNVDKSSVPNEYRDFIERMDTKDPIIKGNKMKLK